MRVGEYPDTQLCALGDAGRCVLLLPRLASAAGAAPELPGRMFSVPAAGIAAFASGLDGVGALVSHREPTSSRAAVGVSRNRRTGRFLPALSTRS